jgi:hypothetical protein
MVYHSSRQGRLSFFIYTPCQENTFASIVHFCCTDSLLMTHRGGLILSIIICRIGGGGPSFHLPWGPKILLAALGGRTILYIYVLLLSLGWYNCLYHPPILLSLGWYNCLYHPPSSRCIGTDVAYYMYLLLNFTVPK